MTVAIYSPNSYAFSLDEDPSVAGFSGAPVFKLPRIQLGAVSTSQGEFRRVGMVHGNFIDPTGAKFAAVVPAKVIAEAVALASGTE